MATETLAADALAPVEPAAGTGVADANWTPMPARWSDRRTAGLLFGGTLLVYLAVLHGQIDVYDTKAMYAVTENLVNHFALHTGGAGFHDSFHQATPYSPYGIAMSILAVPFYAASKGIGHSAVLVSLVNPLLTSASVVVIYRIGRAFRWGAVHSLMAAVAYGLFTMAVWYSTEGFSEPGVALCVVVIVLGIIRWGQGSYWAPLWVGLAAAAAPQFRSDSLFTVWVGLLAVPLFVPWRRILRVRPLAMILGPMGLSAVLLVVYNELRFHRPFVSSYGSGQGLDNPLGHGLHGLLFSSGKSLFLYNPLAVLGVVGLVLLLVRARPVGLLMLFLIVPRILFFSKWSVWDGGWCWGPRFLLPTLPLFMLAAVEVLRASDPRRWPGVAARVSAGVLAAASVVANFLSVRVPISQWLGVLATPAQHALYGLPALVGGGARQQAADFVWSTGSLWGNAVLVRHGTGVMAPDLWLHGHGWLGVTLLVTGLGVVAAAVYGARPSTPHQHARTHSSARTGRLAVEDEPTM